MKKLTTYGLVLAALASGAGCKKFLSTLPDNRAVISTPGQTSQLLTSAYPHASYMLFAEAMSDNAEDKGNSPLGTDPQTYQINVQAYKYLDEQATTGPDLPITYFDSCYHAIAVANQALVYCSGADSASYQGQKGEALLCRAYAHFMLTLLFANTYDASTAASDPGVPYITAVETDVFAKHTRPSVQEDYDNIEADMLAGIALIDESTYGSAPKFHFTSQAAHAFASRFYLFKKDYAKVVQHAGLVFGSSDPSTLIRDNVTDYATLQYNQLSTNYTESNQTANILLQEASTFWPVYYYQYRFGYGLTLNNELFNSANPTGGTYAIITYGSTPQYFNLPKFNSSVGVSNADGSGPFVLPLFSMEEVLFNRAEAYANLGSYDAALADLNAWVSKNVKDYDPSANDLTAESVQDFYGLAEKPAIVQAALDFKRIAYLEEGLRWLDVLRLHIPVTHTTTGFTTTLSANDKRRLLQFPAEAANEGVQLNPR